ncbi:S-layer homology domain-containing protein [Paenibacillus pinihumi]|uniref:S-layer homology domain-containing protein n=1 Tax=Paenibacillus pinihumi TaxID=669462 RepID=UPI001FE032CD|nr:S-layer homology domain-containing protein [Paenibacillus pinihumi]
MRKTLALFLALILILTSNISGMQAVAAAVTAPKTTVLQNEFIKVTVDNSTGRFGIRTVEGQPIRKKDQNVDMLFRGDDPETSFTTFRIDGTDYIFGNPYKFASGLFSEITTPRIVSNPNGTRQIETVWKIKGVEIKQILMLYSNGADKKNAGNVNVRYEVLNRSGAKVELGSRILLDTMVAGNDGPQFQIGTTYRAPLMVERKLVHDPKKLGIPDEDVAFYKLPPYWVMRDTLDLTNPLATNVVAYGFNNFAEGNINLVDEMIVGHWNGLANTKWDYTPNPNLDFTRDTNDYGTADSAVAFYWQPKVLADKAMQTFETVYGLGEIIEPDKVFSIRYIDPVQQLSTLQDNSDYANEGVFDIIAEVENLASFNMEQSTINVELSLQSGLNFVKLDEQGRIVRDANGKVATEAFRSKSLEFRKPATPEEAAQGIIPKYKPGDTITVSFKVQAKGRPWPVTREYMLKASSPETQAKLEGIQDEGIKAQYESSKANFILLPAVGNAVPTYVYALSPKELYSKDIKYVTLNLSNIEAYNTGNDTAAPNFDLYLKEKVTGKRYKVPVKDSVILQPTDDGFSGDMRIAYRGGDLVDAAGNVIQAGLGPELPLGEYQVQIDFKGDTGGDADIAAMYDITTTQSFMVTDNPKSRIREAKIMALYKQTVDLKSVATGGTPGKELLDELNSLFPGEPFTQASSLYTSIAAFRQTKTLFGIASKAVDSKFKLDEFLSEDSLEEVPAYNYKLFSSEKDMEDFFDEESVEGGKREKLVVVRGMIREVGEGKDLQAVVDTRTEPAIINESVAYKGKDMVFVRGKLDIFGVKNRVNGYDRMPFFDSLFVKGDGLLSVAGSGFVFHRGEWTLDFYNGFNKTVGDGLVEDEDEDEDEKEDDKKDKGNEDNPEDDSLNGSLKWAVGGLGDRINPLRQVMIEKVYFNKHSLFAAPSFSVSGFGFSFNDFILRDGGISFGGTLKLKVVEGEVKNVVFNEKGFVGVDASMKFELNQDLGLLGSKKDKKDKKGKKDDGGDVSGELNVVHYVQPVKNIDNQYGIKFKADLKNTVEVEVELGFKQVKDGRVLPDVVAFGTTLGKPGVMITGATYLTAIRGAIRELADTIAGGSDKDPFPLVVQAGVDLKFGVSPVNFFGKVDLTVKRTGFKVEGKMDFSANPNAGKDDLIPMLSYALLEAQWMTPWFVRLAAEVDIGGWDVIIGKAGIFVGQNLEKNRIDFEGYIGSRVQIPSSVPVVGGLPLSSVFFGLNNDKVWGSIGILFISLGITYYWGGGIEFGTSGGDLPDGMIHLVIDDPEKGPRLLVIGQGVETVATSWIDAEQASQGVVYRSIAEGVSVLENGAVNTGIGGIITKNGGRIHEIPMSGISGNAIIEMQYDQKDMPSFTLKDRDGKLYPVVFDNTNTNPQANAFTQEILAAQSPDGVDSRKAYIILPADRVNTGGTWTLTSVTPVETRLLNVPVAPGLQDVKLTKDSDDLNKFKASWQVENAQPGDTINLYLTEDAVTQNKTVLANGEEVLEPGEPGMLIAKDLPVDHLGVVSGKVTSGSTDIDVTKVSILGAQEDIRGLLQQGSYYLRVELKSHTSFGTKTSAEKFDIIDPLAPNKVSDVEIEPAGNGLFALSFKPGARKPGQDSFEQSYMIEALQSKNGKLEKVESFGDLLFTAEELAPNWNSASGRYEGILIGGWSATSTSDNINTASLEGTVLDLKDVKYTGLQTGQEYIAAITVAAKPPKEADKNENYHFAEQSVSLQKLLPVPKKPVLGIRSDSGTVTAPGAYTELLTGKLEQVLEITADQKDIEIEAFYEEKSLGKTVLASSGAGSKGTLKLDQFKTDGPYAIELIARNKKTRDKSVTMLYLTVDTIAPVLYIDQPLTGERTTNGKIKVSGTTSNDASLKVNGKLIEVGDDGKFDAAVEIASADPTAVLEFIAMDGAGNGNQATVQISNDRFEIPAALVIKEVKAVQPGESQSLQAFLKVATGKDAGGKPKFKEVAIPAGDKRLSYKLQKGDSVQVTDTGRVTGLVTGGSVIEATYQVTDEVSLNALALAAVKGLDSITAASSAIQGEPGKTKLTVSGTGDMDGQQLVYKVFAKGTSVALPVYLEDLSSWSILPASGEISASEGDSVLVAKRLTQSKQATALSSKLTAKVWSAPGNTGGGGFGGGGGGPVVNTGPVEVSVDGQKVKAERTGNEARLHLKSGQVNIKESSDLIISAKDTSASSYDLLIDKSNVEQLRTKKSKLRLELPGAAVELGPDKLAGLNGDLHIQIGASSAVSVSGLKTVANGLKVSLLGGDQGTAIKINLPESGFLPFVNAAIALPEHVKAGEISAVILRSENGSWTTVPWKLEQINGKTYARIHLTGSGSIGFLGGSGKVFKDVAATFWGQQSIQEASAKLFVLGKSADRFEPDSRITRAEYPTILLRVGGWLNRTAVGGFTDVAEKDWFSRSVSVAAELGIVTGKANGAYEPNAALSRIEAMTMAGRMLGVLGLAEELSDQETERILGEFKDGAEIPAWARKPVALTIKQGLIRGENGSINPQGVLTRAQAAAIAIRLDQFITGKS